MRQPTTMVLGDVVDAYHDLDSLERLAGGPFDAVLADCEGAPCDFKDFDDVYDAVCACPYVTATMDATASTKKIRRATAKSCREISATHGDCALQETLEPGELMADYDAMETLHGYLADARFRRGGTACKTYDD